MEEAQGKEDDWTVRLNGKGGGRGDSQPRTEMPV